MLSYMIMMDAWMTCEDWKYSYIFTSDCNIALLTIQVQSLTNYYTHAALTQIIMPCTNGPSILKSLLHMIVNV